MKYSKAIYSVKQTRKIEEYLIQESKIPEFDLMYEAGKAVFDILESKLATYDKKNLPFLLFLVRVIMVVMLISWQLWPVKKVMMFVV